MNSLLALMSCILMLTTDFSSTPTVVVPEGNSQKVIYSKKQAAPNPAVRAVGNGINGIGKGMGGVTQQAGKGAGWFFGELLRPVEALRNGLIDVFGVKEPTERRQ